jgi:hypothetical protein
MATQYRREVVSASIGASNTSIAINSAIPVTLPPDPRTGFARGRFFTSKSRPQRCYGNSLAVHRDGRELLITDSYGCANVSRRHASPDASD